MDITLILITLLFEIENNTKNENKKDGNSESELENE